jgi:hypothetical protein
MADGTTKPIAAVAVGDQVQSTDPATGKTSEQPVTALHLNHDTDLVDVTVANDKGQTTVLHTTWHHPFWNETTHQWTDAADLKPGTQLHSANGSVEHVVAVRTWTGLDWMRDLTVATNHTYYVVAGSTPVLVHNCGGGNWKPTDVDGQRVYQRDDLVDPNYTSPADKYGRTNLKRMQQGLAPMGPDDNPMVLHHMLQTQDGPLAELTQTMHQGWFRQLHINVGTDIPSGIDRAAFGVWKTAYWKSRAAGFL